MKLAVRELFVVDSRSLAAFRIAISIVLLVDLGIRAADLEVMYTDDGMFSRTLIARHYSIWNWSVHFASGSWWCQAVLFGFAAVCALALLAGCETRLATVASWLMLVSLHNRAPVILSGADNLLRMLLFWAMFLPLGGVWSVDAWLAKRRGSRRANVAPERSVASAAILLQMAFVYLFSAVFKSNGEWFRGTAVAAILSDGFYGKPIAAGLLEFPGVLALLTVSVLALEWLGPFLLFSPIWTGRLRLWTTGLLAAMHVGIEATLNVGLFSVVSLSGLILFLPAFFWKKLLRPFSGATNDPGRPETTERIPPGPAPVPRSFAARGACALALAYVLFANINGLPGGLLPWTPVPKTEFLTVACGLGQQWDMFSRAPPKNGWCVAQATLVDGGHVDLLRRGAPVLWERPYNPAAAYPSHRWLKLFRELSYAETQGIDVIRQPVAEYLCREWNRSRASDQRVSDFVLVFCTERRDEYGLDPAPATIRETLVHLEFAGQAQR
jgi:hypothetical protein